MSTAWLKVIGESKHPRERYEESFIGFPKRQRPRNIRVGDQMVLYAVGGSKNVFVHVEVVSEVYERSEWPQWPHSIDVRYLVNLPVSEGVHIDEIRTPERDLRGRKGRKVLPQAYAGRIRASSEQAKRG